MELELILILLTTTPQWRQHCIYSVLPDCLDLFPLPHRGRTLLEGLLVH